MQRAIQIASLGIGSAAPNPMVGALIVKNGEIIGEGFHRRYKTEHAEVRAIESVPADKRHLIEGSTVYVTLEPCAHQSHTPPCADLLVREKIARCVIAVGDPNPQVGGKGISRLRNAGIEVEVGVLEAEAIFLARRFLKRTQVGKPYIILKWAESADRFIGRKKKAVWLTCHQSRKLVHKWRSEEAAILIGTNTAIVDDPQLNVRMWSGNDPKRFVLDARSKLDPNSKLFKANDPAYAIVSKDLHSIHENTMSINFYQVWEQLLQGVSNLNCSSLIVEGGANIIRQFIQKDLWDEARVFKTQKHLRKGVKAPRMGVDFDSVQTVGIDQLYHYFRK